MNNILFLLLVTVTISMMITLIRSEHNQNVIYFDMDGVLAVWNDVPYQEILQKGYFLNRKLELQVSLAIKALKDAGYDVRILTCAPSRRSAKEKKTWLAYYGLANIPVQIIPDGKNKNDYVMGYNILVDDFHKNLSEWQGVSVKFYNGINGNGGTEYRYSINSQMDASEIKEYLSDIADSLKAA